MSTGQSERAQKCIRSLLSLRHSLISFGINNDDNDDEEEKKNGKEIGSEDETSDLGDRTSSQINKEREKEGEGGDRCTYTIKDDKYQAGRQTPSPKKANGCHSLPFEQAPGKELCDVLKGAV